MFNTVYAADMQTISKVMFLINNKFVRAKIACTTPATNNKTSHYSTNGNETVSYTDALCLRVSQRAVVQSRCIYLRRFSLCSPSRQKDDDGEKND